MDELDEMERMLKEQLMLIQRSYQETASPIIKRLVEIQRLRPAPPVFLQISSERFKELFPEITNKYGEHG